MVGRHGISNEQIYKIAEFQEFKCALSKVPFEIIDGEIYDPTTKKKNRNRPRPYNWIYKGTTDSKSKLAY